MKTNARRSRSQRQRATCWRICGLQKTKSSRGSANGQRLKFRQSLRRTAAAILKNNFPQTLHPLCHAARSPQSGDEHGEDYPVSATSCAGLFCRKKIRPQRRTRYTGLTFDRQYKLRRNAMPGFGQPIPDLSLRRANTLGEPALAAGSFTGKFECFVANHVTKLPIFR